MSASEKKTGEQIEFDQDSPATGGQILLPTTQVALLSLVRRARFCWLYPLLFQLVAQLVEPRVNRLMAWVFVWLADITVGAVRLFLIARMSSAPALTPADIRLWGWVTPLHGFLISWAVSEWYLAFGFDTQGLIATLVLSAMTLSILVTYRPNLRILRRTVLSLLVPPILTALWIGGSAGWAVGLTLLGVLTFCLYQGRVENLDFWGALHAVRDVKVATQRVQTAAQLHSDLMARRARQSILAAERSRIASEWHDTLLAGLSAIAWQLDVIHDRSTDQAQATQALGVARAMLKQCRNEARLVIADLQGPPDDSDFKTTLSQAIQPLIGSRSVNLDLEVAGQCPILPSATKHHLIRICQEAVNNALQHAAPQSISVKVAASNSQLKVEISDDGAGFQVAHRPAGHFGLTIMQERARGIGGNLTIRSTPGLGSQVLVEIPVIPVPEHSKARVLIVEPQQQQQPASPTPLQSILASKANLEIVNVSNTGASAINSFKEYLPNLTIIAPRLPDMSGLAVRRAIHGVDPFAKVLVIRDSGAAEKSLLFDSIDAILAKAPQALDLDTTSVHAQFPQAELSRRERDVLEQLVQGANNREIATCLGISERSVALCITQITKKIGAGNRASAVEVALLRGIVDPPLSLNDFTAAN